MHPNEIEFKNLNDKELAEKYSCSTRTIQRWRRKLQNKRFGWGPGKLNMEKAREIRDLYRQKGLTQVVLAKMYHVSQAAIGRVVNNVSYPEKNVGLSGTSPCVVNYLVK